MDSKRSASTLALVLAIAIGAFSGCSKIQQDTITDSMDSNTDTEDSITMDASTLEDTSSDSTDTPTDTYEVATVEDTSLVVETVPVTEAIPITDVTSTLQTQSTPLETTSLTVADGFALPADGSVATSSVAVESISLDRYEVSVSVGKSVMPIVTMSPSNASDKSEVWESSNTQVATVDSLGNIKGVSEGTCTVTVKSKSNPSAYAQVSVTVTAEVTTVAQTTTASSNDDSNGNGDVEPTYIEGILIVNKSYGLPQDYDPYGGTISPEAQEAFNLMAEDAKKEGLNLYISSGYRSYDYQVGLYERYAKADGYDAADLYSARPGYSEHQSGLCFDLNTIDDSFADTAEGKWVAENCYKYGFIVRYPLGKESVTGYQYEPWHLRYLGTFLATDVYNSGLCLEEYLGVDSQYAD